MPVIANPIKRGSTLEFVLEMTEAEWSMIYPYDEAKCEAEIKRMPSDATWTEYEFDVTAYPPTRTIHLSARSTDLWPEGGYRMDVRFSKGGRHYFVPTADFIEFKLISPATDDEVITV